MEKAIFLAIGIVSGIAGGMFGIGGGILIVPGLILLAGMSQKSAQGTSLAALLLPIGFLGAWRYFDAGHVRVGAAALIGVGFFLGALVGANFAVNLPEVVLRRTFSGFLILVAIYLAW